MARYEVVLAAGLDFPVGKEFESDNLHPVMFQHVKQVGGKTAKPVEGEAEEIVKPLTKKQLEALHAEALKEDGERFPVAKPEATAPADGPGENS